MEKPLIFGHRGSAVLAPENTIVAFDLALDYGASVLETDVRTSSDGIPVIHHDAKLDRTTNGTHFVSNYSLDQLKALDAGYHFKSLSGESFRGRGIQMMTLEELLAHYPDTPINVEIKHPKAEFASVVADVIRQSGRKDTVTVASFHSGITEAFRQAAPEIATAATRDEILGLYYSQYSPANLWRRMTEDDDEIRQAALDQPDNGKAYKTLQIPTHFKRSILTLDLSSADFISHLKHQGLSVTYWTINDVEEMIALAERGASGIVTDRVDLAQKVFGL